MCEKGVFGRTSDPDPEYGDGDVYVDDVSSIFVRQAVLFGDGEMAVRAMHDEAIKHGLMVSSAQWEAQWILMIHQKLSTLGPWQKDSFAREGATISNYLGVSVYTGPRMHLPLMLIFLNGTVEAVTTHVSLN
jgi:hypothetical protein